ncbi:MAG: hypothetical protein DMF88_13215 [Acidobacteria bacterium]|nr:MAG: hypothetical protein DMF88_13215 [Acidobacteriota bacterium]
MSGPVIGIRGAPSVAGFSGGRAHAAASSSAAAITAWRVMASCPTITPIMMKRYALVLSLVLGIGGATLLAQTVTKETLPGVTNFSKLETTIACAGATTPAAVEAGADVDAEAAAAKTAGITYIHLPFNTAMPDPAVADKFITAVTDKKNQPAFVHCASANRAAAMWMIKRMVVDKWDADRAGTEAAALGLTNGALKTFAMNYAAAHKP